MRNCLVGVAPLYLTTVCTSVSTLPSRSTLQWTAKGLPVVPSHSLPPPHARDHCSVLKLCLCWPFQLEPPSEGIDALSSSVFSSLCFGNAESPFYLLALTWVGSAFELLSWILFINAWLQLQYLCMHINKHVCICYAYAHICIHKCTPVQTYPYCIRLNSPLYKCIYTHNYISFQHLQLSLLQCKTIHPDKRDKHLILLSRCRPIQPPSSERNVYLRRPQLVQTKLQEEWKQQRTIGIAPR